MYFMRQRLSVVVERLVPRRSKAAGNGERAFIVFCFWPPLVDLGGHRPTDPISLFLCSEPL